MGKSSTPAGESSSAEQEVERQETECLSDEEEEYASEASESWEDAETSNLTIKSKKKKKKKKKKPAGAAAASSNGPADRPANKQENDKRYSSAVQEIAANSDDLLWVRLDRCNLHESKTRKLAEALEKNQYLTSLDLSGNQINNEAIENLARALEDGAAPELIFLDVRNNPFGLNGEDALESLQRTRKHLRVEVRNAEAESAESDAESAADSHGSAGEWAIPEAGTEGTDTVARFASPIHHAVAPYFQVAREGKEGAATQDKVPEDPALIASTLWSEVEWGYEESPSNVPRMGAALHALVLCCDEELSLYGASSLTPRVSTAASGRKSSVNPKERFAQLRPHTRAAAEHLKLCSELLGVESPEILTPFSRGHRHMTVGTHRMAVAEVVARLLSMCIQVVDAAVADSDLVPHILRLCLDRPHCSPLQVMCIRIVRSALESPESRLWAPLLKPNLGMSRWDAPPNQDGLPQGSRASLQTHLALVGEAAHTAPPGRHGCDVGFAIHIADVLRTRYNWGSALGHLGEELEPAAAGDQASQNSERGDQASQQEPGAEAWPDEGHAGASWFAHGDLSGPSMELAQLLEADEAWQDFSMPEGTLDDFLSMADGELCGPRPNRGVFGTQMTTTGQVLPSTHALEEQVEEEGDGPTAPEGPLEDSKQDLSHVFRKSGVTKAPLQLSNGELHSLMDHVHGPALAMQDLPVGEDIDLG